MLLFTSFQFYISTNIKTNTLSNLFSENLQQHFEVVYLEIITSKFQIQKQYELYIHEIIAQRLRKHLSYS